MPLSAVRVKPVCFQSILFPAFIVGVAVLAANVVQVAPSSKLYCNALVVNVNVVFSNAVNVKYCLE